MLCRPAASSSPLAASTVSGPRRRRLRRDLRWLRRATRTQSRHSWTPRSGEQHSHRHRLALERLVRPCLVDRPPRDRPRRRQHRDGLLPDGAALGGAEVHVVVRSGFAEMKASPWEKEDAMREGVAIMNFLAPKAFMHAADCLTGVVFEKMAPQKTSEDAASSPQPASGRDNRMRRRADRGWPGKRVPLDRKRRGVSFGRDGMPMVDPVTFQLSLPKLFLAVTPRLARRNYHPVARGHEERSRYVFVLPGRGCTCASGFVDHSREPEVGHPRMVVRQRHHFRPPV